MSQASYTSIFKVAAQSRMGVALLAGCTALVLHLLLSLFALPWFRADRSEAVLFFLFLAVVIPHLVTSCRFKSRVKAWLVVSVMFLVSFLTLLMVAAILNGGFDSFPILLREAVKFYAPMAFSVGVSVWVFSPKIADQDAQSVGQA